MYNDHPWDPKILAILNTWSLLIYVQSVPGIVALLKWKTHAGKVKNACRQSEKCAPGTTIVDSIWWRAMFLCLWLNFLYKFLTFQLAEPKKQHTKNNSSIFMNMRVTIPGTAGKKFQNPQNWRWKVLEMRRFACICFWQRQRCTRRGFYTHTHPQKTDKKVVNKPNVNELLAFG